MPRARDNGYIASHGVPDAVELWKRVTVGPDVFEALSSEERISILKLLDQNRQMTGTDVANVLAISKSSAFKQLNRLARAGLVERMDEGRKWIYYRNTSKAERLLHPEDVTITLVLSAALAAVTVGLLLLLAVQPVLGPGASLASDPSGNDPSVLILGKPTGFGGDLSVQVYAGSAKLTDLSLYVALDSTGDVLASTAQPGQLQLLAYGSSSAGGAYISVTDADGNGELNAGDSIEIRGLGAAEGCTLWVSSSAGRVMASAPLGA